MNQFYRALHMPPKRRCAKSWAKKKSTPSPCAPAPLPRAPSPLPALEGGPYTLLPRREGWWFADPLLYHRRGKRWLFAEAMDLSTGKGRLEVCELHDDGAPPTTGASRWKKISTCRSRWSLTGTVRSG